MALPAVFLVDDDPDSLDYMRVLVSDAGYEPVCASDGAAAIEQMKASPPAMAILDIQMDGMNGFEMLRDIRACEDLADMPVVFLSGIGAITGITYDPKAIESDYGVRPDAFLPKPAEPTDVLEVLRKFAGQAPSGQD